MLANNLYSNANLKWNYNALASVEPNGIIITIGDIDCIPKWVLQYGAGVRTDVLSINKWLLADHEDYRTEILKKLKWTSPLKDGSIFQNVTDYADYLMAEIIKHADRPVYVTAGTPKSYFKKYNLDHHIYLVGNALKYSEQSFNNTEIMIDNFENKYFVEYLMNNYQHHYEDHIVKSEMNLTYLPGLVHLKKYYTKLGDSDRQAYYTMLIDQIATASGQKQEVLSWFK